MNTSNDKNEYNPSFIRRYPVVVSILFFIFLWLILELICGAIYNRLPESFSNGKRIVEKNLGHSYPNSKSSIIPHPYLLYVNNPEYVDSMKQNNSLGYRNEEFNIEKDTNTIRILALGGSTTYGFLEKNREKTWPFILEKKLQELVKNKKIEVINGGLNNANSAELLAAYVFRHRYLKLDIIIFHEGGNDAMPVFFPNYNPEYSHMRSAASSMALRNGEKFLLRSNFFKIFYSFWLNNQGTVYTAAPSDHSKLPPNEVWKRVNDDANYTGFERNVELLIKLAKMDGSKVVLFGFLCAREENISRNQKDLLGLEKCVWTATEKNKSIMKELAESNGCVYVNPEQDKFKDEWFKDNCHLTPEGEEVKAEIIFNQLSLHFFQ